MAGYAKVKRECDRMNKDRDVDYLHQLQADRFWEKAEGNFVITGGTTEERQEQLIYCLKKLQRNGNAPIFLLNQCREIEKLLIQLATEGQLGKLAVFSPEYPNYELLYQAEAGLTADLLSDLAADKNKADLQLYADAFLEILSTEYPISLTSMLAFAGNSDEDIAAFGIEHGAGDSAVQNIRHYADAGNYFRSILNRIYRAASGITVRSCDSHYNLIRAGQENRPLIVLIDMNTQSPEFLYSCLAAELRTLLGMGCSFHLIFNELSTQLNAQMQSILQDVQIRSRCTAGICTENIAAWGRDTDRLMKNVNTTVILNSISWNIESLNVILGSFGIYQHYEPVLAKGNPAKLFAVLTDEHWTTSVSERNRIRPIDMKNVHAVVKGHQGCHIALVKQFRYQGYINRPVPSPWKLLP